MIPSITPSAWGVRAATREIAEVCGIPQRALEATRDPGRRLPPRPFLRVEPDRCPYGEIPATITVTVVPPLMFVLHSWERDSQANLTVKLRGYWVGTVPAHRTGYPPIPTATLWFDRENFVAQLQSRDLAGEMQESEVINLIAYADRWEAEHWTPRILGHRWFDDGVPAATADEVIDDILWWVSDNGRAGGVVNLPISEGRFRAALCFINAFGVTAREILANTFPDVIFLARGREVVGPASRKSLDLLRRWLSPAQLGQFDADGAFDVVGCHTGGIYRVSKGRSYNVAAPDGDHLCFVPVGASGVGDFMLAQKIALETDERGALRVANRRPGRNPIY